MAAASGAGEGRLVGNVRHGRWASPRAWRCWWRSAPDWRPVGQAARREVRYDTPVPQPWTSSSPRQDARPQPSSAPPGVVNFTVTNKNASSVTEVELRQADGYLLAEQPNLAPGVLGGISASLTDGTYQIYCPGADQTTSTLHGDRRLHRPDVEEESPAGAGGAALQQLDHDGDGAAGERHPSLRLSSRSGEPGSGRIALRSRSCGLRERRGGHRDLWHPLPGHRRPDREFRQPVRCSRGSTRSKRPCG